MVFRLIPKGEFLMGSPENEEGRHSDEHQHRVRISQPFFMGAHEVTVGQFRHFVGETSYRTEAERDGGGSRGWNEDRKLFEGPFPKYTWRNTGFAQTDNHPVVNVSWNDAIAFCQWLSRVEGVEYRLPTEAEWEYACRAGSLSRNSFGDGDERLTRFANVADRAAEAHWVNYQGLPYARGCDGCTFTAPVGCFLPNRFGLYDMHGNVWEWRQDWDGFDYFKTSPIDDPQGLQNGSSRIYRGAGYKDTLGFCRSSNRDGDAPAGRRDSLGFRIVRLIASRNQSEQE